MRRLVNRSARDKGAATVLVGLLLFVLVIGAGAIAVDVGTLWSDRKNLQNGVDAAVLSMATECSTGPEACASAKTALAAAQEASFYVSGAYGNPLTAQSDCTDDGVHGGVCVTFSSGKQVTVYAWDYVIPAFPLIPMLGSGAGRDKLKVGATASAKWEVPSLPLILNKTWFVNADGTTKVPLGGTITVCPDANFTSNKWPTLNSNGTVSNPLPGGGYCVNDKASTSGNFYGLDTTYPTCFGVEPNLFSTNPDTYTLNVTVGLPSRCDYRGLMEPGNTVYIPYFDPTTLCVANCTGSSGAYVIVKYGAWEVKGYCVTIQAVTGNQGGGTEADGLTPVATDGGCNKSGAQNLPLRLALTFKALLNPEDLKNINGVPIRLIS